MPATNLDHALPSWHHREWHHTTLAAPGWAVWRAVEHVSTGQLPAFRCLMLVGSLGRTQIPRDEPMLAQLLTHGFTVLSRTSDELVIGAVVALRQPNGPAPQGPATPGPATPGPVALGSEPISAFRDFDRGGHYKVALNFRFVEGELSTETRVLTTDAATRRRFRRYWRLIRIPSGLIRKEWLRAIRRDAEAAMSRAA